MPKFNVLVWKTETWRGYVEVEADTEEDALSEAEEEVEHTEVVWDYVESTIEADRVEEIEDEEA